MYTFKIPIGDWSNDGHGIADWYIVQSNKSVEEVRELYFQACKMFGFGLDTEYKDAPCIDYEDSVIPIETLYLLEDFGVKAASNLLENLEVGSTECYVDPDNFINIVLEFIKTQDRNLELDIVDIPMFQFYGFDSKERHIGYFGYGLFQ